MRAGTSVVWEGEERAVSSRKRSGRKAVAESLTDQHLMCGEGHSLRAELTSQSLELIPHARQAETVTREVLRHGKLERSRVRGELEFAGLAELLDDRRVKDEGLHGEASEVKSPTDAGQDISNALSARLHSNSPLLGQIANPVSAEDLFSHERQLLRQVDHVATGASACSRTVNIEVLGVVYAMHSSDDGGEVAANSHDERARDGGVGRAGVLRASDSGQPHTTWEQYEL